MLRPNHSELKTMLRDGGCRLLALMPYLPIPEGVTTREQYRHLTQRRAWRISMPVDRILHVVCLLLLAALLAKGQVPTARATAAAPALTERAMVPLSVDLTGALRTAAAAGSGGLTNTELRATPVPVSGTFWQATQPVSGTFWQTTQPISGTVTANAGTGTFAVSGPLTDAQLRLTAVPVSGTFWQTTQPVSGTVTANAGTGTFAVSGPLTDAQLRAVAVPVSGTVTANAGTGTMAVSGPLTDTQLRATAVPVSGTVTANAGTGNMSVVGAAASGVAKAGNPVQTGAVFTTAQPTVTTGQVVEAQATARGALIVAAGVEALNVTVNAALPAGAAIIGSVSVNQTTPGTTNAVSLAQIGATAVVNGGLAGTQGVGGTAANNAVITQNPILAGVEALSTQPVAATTGNQRRLVGSLDGALYVREGGPVQWTCSLDAIAATLTICQAAPAAGLRLYVTDIVATSVTATAGLMLLRYGTAAACGTGTTSIFPAAATVVRVPYPANTVIPLVVNFRTPLILPAANALCAIAVATNTLSITITGFTAP